MSIFRLGDFVLASGKRTPWKIECDDLTKEDWATLAAIAGEIIDLDQFSAIVPVPRGGVPFAEALLGRKGATVRKGPRLIVDDVLTTGRSITDAMDQSYDRGLVVFARGPLPIRVTALFRMAVHG